MKSTSITCDACGAEIGIRHDSYPSGWRLRIDWESIPTDSPMIHSIAMSGPDPRISGDFCGVHCLFDHLYEVGYRPHEGRT